MEPPFSIQALRINPFPSRFINRTLPFRTSIKKSGDENIEMTAVLS